MNSKRSVLMTHNHQVISQARGMANQSPGFLALFSFLTLLVCFGSSTALAQEKVLTERSLTKQTTWYQRTEVSHQQLKQFIDDKKARIVDLEISSTAPLKLSASLVKNTGKHAKQWWWYFDQTAQQVAEKLRQHKARLIDLDVYQDQGKLRYAIVMVSNQGADAQAWWWFPSKTKRQLEEFVDQEDARIVDIERYRHAGKTHFAAVLLKNKGAKKTDWWWYVGITKKKLKKHLREHKAQLLDFESYRTPDGVRYAAVMVPRKKGKKRVWFYTKSSRDELVDLGRRHGARLVDIETPASGVSGYSGVFVNNGMIRDGQCGGKFKGLDARIIKAMKNNAIPGASVAVVKGDRLVHSCAFGYADLGRNKSMSPNHLLRIASVSKPVTVAALNRLAQTNKINLSHKMIHNLGKARPDEPYADQKIKDISIQHLIDHRGGWDRGKGVNPMFMPGTIAAELGTPKPTSCRNVMRYMFQKQELDFTPGTKPSGDDADPYSNFAYCILGRVVEKASKQSYKAYVRQQILKPIGITNMKIGRGLRADRQRNEVQYYDQPQAKKVTPVYPNAPEKVSHPDGGFHIEAMDAHGGWIASANDIARFATLTNPYDRTDWQHLGALTGTSSLIMKRGDISVAILMNARMKRKTKHRKDQVLSLVSLAEKGLADVKQWPAKRNLWTKYGYANIARRANP